MKRKVSKQFEKLVAQFIKRHKRALKKLAKA